MKSMTGFGRGSALLDGIEVAVELSSVNRRNLEVTFSMPKEWQALERVLTDELRTALTRGKVYATISTTRASASGALLWDTEAVEESLARLGLLAESKGVDWPPDADTLLRIIQMHRIEEKVPGAAEAEATVVAALRDALKALEEMRAHEGDALERDLLDRLARLNGWLAEIRSMSAGTVPAYRDVLLARLRQLGLEIDLDDERVLKEISIFADRCDVSEELTRLDNHFVQFRETIERVTGTESIGRKLEFILQEINREFNTVGSKCNNTEVSRIVIDCKNEIERIREQIQNVE